jgi:hypothetical protein
LFIGKKSPAALFSRPYTGYGGKKRGFCRLPRRSLRAERIGSKQFPGAAGGNWRV